MSHLSQPLEVWISYWYIDTHFSHSIISNLSGVHLRMHQFLLACSTLSYRAPQTKAVFYLRYPDLQCKISFIWGYRSVSIPSSQLFSYITFQWHCSWYSWWLRESLFFCWLRWRSSSQLRTIAHSYFWCVREWIFCDNTAQKFCMNHIRVLVSIYRIAHWSTWNICFHFRGSPKWDPKFMII